MKRKNLKKGVRIQVTNRGFMMGARYSPTTGFRVGDRWVEVGEEMTVVEFNQKLGECVVRLDSGELLRPDLGTWMPSLKAV